MNFFNTAEQYSSFRINGIKEETFDKIIPIKHGNSLETTSQFNTGNKTSDNNHTETPIQLVNKIPENAEQTTSIVLRKLNKEVPELKLKIEDIDICHRIGKRSKDADRQIIVKFTSRLVRNKVLRHKKSLPKNIFVNEDLTRTNHLVLMCMKKKLPDEVDTSWTMNGDVFYRNKMGNVHKVQYREYNSWFDLPWPKADAKQGNK